MAYTTTVYPARVALDALLRAWSWPDPSPTIAWGPPTETDDTRLDLVYQGSPETPEDEYLVLGGTRLDEEYELVVVVDVRQWGDDEQATEARAWGHFNQLMQLIHENHTLSGTVDRITGVRFTPANVPGGPQQWRSQIAVRVAVVGYVTP